MTGETGSDRPVTRLLAELQGGNQDAADRLIPLIYDELRVIARQALAREHGPATTPATALVHEAFFRLAGENQPWKNRAHFFGIASRVMRQVLVDHARKRKAAKRGSGNTPASIDEGLAIDPSKIESVLVVHDVLEKLESLDPRQARIVEMRFFAGLEVEEVAEAMGISPTTVKREWASAKAWLRRELERAGSS